jgi:hypothetical protein
VRQFPVRVANGKWLHLLADFITAVSRGGSRNQRKGGPENLVLRENLQDRMQIQFLNILFPKNYALRSRDIFENKIIKILIENKGLENMKRATKNVLLL